VAQRDRSQDPDKSAAEGEFDSGLARRENQEKSARIASAIGAILRKSRQHKGLQRRAVSDRLGVGESTLGHWENGKYLLPLHHLPALAQILGRDAYAIIAEALGETTEYEQTVREQIRAAVTAVVLGLQDQNQWSPAELAGTFTQPLDLVVRDEHGTPTVVLQVTAKQYEPQVVDQPRRKSAEAAEAGTDYTPDPSPRE
jgi:transcriptional regulator with XRE-family HTH domain